MTLPDLPGGWNWKKMAVVAAAAAIVVAVGFLSGTTGPVQGSSGIITFLRTDIDCAIYIEIQTGDMASATTKMLFFADQDVCYLNRELSAVDTHGREGVSESIKAVTGGKK